MQGLEKKKRKKREGKDSPLKKKPGQTDVSARLKAETL